MRAASNKLVQATAAAPLVFSAARDSLRLDFAVAQVPTAVPHSLGVARRIRISL